MQIEIPYVTDTQGWQLSSRSQSKHTVESHTEGGAGGGGGCGAGSSGGGGSTPRSEVVSIDLGKSKKVSSEPYLPETRAWLSVVLTTMVYLHHDGIFHTLFG